MLRYQTVVAAALLAISARTFAATTATESAQPISAKVQFVVCVDAGHPSENGDGGTTFSGVSEVQMCWDVAVRVRDLLEAQGVKVVMTKQSERHYVTNKRRAEIANDTKADLFLRLHTDVSPRPGFAIYYPNKEGRTRDGVKGPEEAVLQMSYKAAVIFYRTYSAALDKELQDNGLKGDDETAIGSKQGALTGSIYSKVPTLLVEMVSLNLKEDGEWIKKPENRNKLGQALTRAALAVRDQ